MRAPARFVSQLWIRRVSITFVEKWPHLTQSSKFYCSNCSIPLHRRLDPSVGVTLRLMCVIAPQRRPLHAVKDAHIHTCPHTMSSVWQRVDLTWTSWSKEIHTCTAHKWGSKMFSLSLISWTETLVGFYRKPYIQRVNSAVQVKPKIVECRWESWGMEVVLYLRVLVVMSAAVMPW